MFTMPASRAQRRRVLLPTYELTATAIKTANYAASVGDLVVCNTAGGGFTVYLPSPTRVGDLFGVYLATAGSNLTVNGNGRLIDGAATQTVSAVSSYQVWQFNGTQWVTVQAEGEAILASISSATTLGTTLGVFSHVVPDAGGTFQVVLPVAGMYKLGYLARPGLAYTAGSGTSDAFQVFRLYDGTNPVANSEMLTNFTKSAGVISTGSISDDGITYLATAATTITMYVAPNSDGSNTIATNQVASDANGRTRMWYRKV